jgi:hypothetical protein
MASEAGRRLEFFLFFSAFFSLTTRLALLIKVGAEPGGRSLRF